MSHSHSCQKVRFTFYPSLLIFYEDHDKECLLTKVEEFYKCSFVDICSQRLTTSPYIYLELVSSNFKREKYCG